MTADVLWCAVVAVEAVALVLAAVVARTPSRRAHLPIVVLLALAVVADLAIAAGKVAVLDHSPRPFVGLDRVVYHVETALVLAWPSALALTSWRVFADGQPRWYLAVPPSLAWGSWLGLLVGLVLAHPLPRSWTRGVLLANEVAAVIVAWWSVVRGWGRPWRLPHLTLAVLIPAETVVLLLGPWLRNPFASWHLARVTYLFAFSSVVALHVHNLRTTDRASR